MYSDQPSSKLEFETNRFRVKFCPCNKDNRDGKFVPFKGYDDKGYCHSCGITYRPEILENPKENIYPGPWQNSKTKLQTSIDYIPYDVFKRLLNEGIHLYNKNHFVQWLGDKSRGKSVFDSGTILTLIENYFLANSNLYKYKGWILFPYIDINGNVRDIKAMGYNAQTGKRVKEPYSQVVFIGKTYISHSSANTVRCFFGEHLLRGNNKPVKIFESEATAVYASAFFPDCVCIATGGNNGCRWTERDNCIVLKGRDITLYPDIDAHESWEIKAEILRGYGLNVQVSQLIKQNAIKLAVQHGIDYTELVKQKYDLRDILKLKELSDFIQPDPLHNLMPFMKQILGSNFKKQDVPALDSVLIEPVLQEIEIEENWDREITELETYFNSVSLPEIPLRINQWTLITEVPAFVKSHLANVKINNGKERFLPYLHRLQELRNHLLSSKE